jgi:G3E family GTPase
VLSGALGAGKTTTIQHILAHRSPGERWAVLVNEFGLVGLDGALLAPTQPDEVVIEEVPGGCICCTAGLMFQVALALLLQRARPDRVIIEPTGLAGPQSIVRTLRGPTFVMALELRAVITLVDVSRWGELGLLEREVYAEQLAECDILLGSKADLATDAQRQRFLEEALGLFPPKRHIGFIEHGALDMALLELPAPPQARKLEAHELTLWPGRGAGLLSPRGVRRVEAPGCYPSAETLDGVRACGWIFSPEDVFSEARLMAWLGSAAWYARLKGVFRVEDGWLSVNATREQRTLSASRYTADSRVEIIVDEGEAPDWAAVEATLRACRVNSAA